MSSAKYHVIVPDNDYWRYLIKCQAACPVQTDARGYVTALARGEFETGYQIAHDPNPLSTICGRICGAPCEQACRRANIGPDETAVAIRPLKRVLTERHGPESSHRLPGRTAKTIPTPIPLFEPDTFTPAQFSANPSLPGRGVWPGQGPIKPFAAVRWSREELKKLARQPGRRHGRVAVIGGGPSGLTVAHDMGLLGHQVTIFEAGPKLGGMIRYGVPSFRFDQNAFDLEIQEILDMGVEVRWNTPIGQNITLAEVRRDFEVIFLGLGLNKGRLLDSEGVTLDGVITAIDLLLNYNMGHKVELGQRVLVIGGAAAWPADEPDTMHTTLAVARTALRLGATEVKVIMPESWAQLPASAFEVDKALEEGLEIFAQHGPNRIVGANGRVAGVEVADVDPVFDAQGRFNPTLKPATRRVWECDTVILAVGQQADLEALGGASELRLSARGLVEVNPETGQTSVSTIFAGGDIAYGPHLLIDAVRHGHIAALGMEAQLQHRELRVSTHSDWTPIANHVMFENWTKLARRPTPSMPVNRRSGATVVDLGYTRAEAIEQGSRCLECSVNTIFDGSKCILCNGCVDVCPWDCLKIVRLDEITGDDTLPAVVEARLGASLAVWQTEKMPTAAAILKDDDRCTRCALCAERCPTGAITMEAFRFQEVLTYE